MEDILIIDDSVDICLFLSEYVLPDLGYQATVAHTGRQGLNTLRQHVPELILLDLHLPDISGLELLRLIAQEGYDVPVILMTAHGSEGVAVEAFRLGARNYLIKPFSEAEAQAAIDQALRERRLQREKDQLNRNLQQRVQELTVLHAIGKSVSSLLDQEEVLTRIVEAGVFVTHAEEGFLLLHNAQTNQLYLRAAKNIGETRAKALHLSVADTLAGQVIRTAKPIRLDAAAHGAPLKVKTGFLTRALLQVPLIVGTTVIGVLAVDNQQAPRSFTENDQTVLSALADYAALVIENARLYDQARRNEQRYRDLFANAYDLIFTLDQGLRITSANKISITVMGYAEDELLGRPLQSVCTTDTWAQASRQFANLLAGKPIAPFEMQVSRRDGEYVYLEVSARLASSANAFDHIHCIARNLTERRMLEAQLLQAEKLSAIGQLVAGVAHELNNPLTSISGYTQLLLRDHPDSTNIRDDLQQIHRQSERAARIVQGLLMFAREHKPERRAVNLNEIIQDTLALRSYQLKVDDIRVVLAFDPKLPTTVADPFQLQQVVLNLINNAHQAISAKGLPGELRLATEVIGRDTSQPMVRMLVGDTGVGISQRYLLRIFDPFFTTKPVGQGTGLGLSICFGIVQEHGGTIHAESEMGVGTSVMVDLPWITAPIQELAALPSTDHTPDMEPLACRVLIVEDEETVGDVLARLLRELGHTPVVVTKGSDALQLLQREMVDVVLTDIRMPGLNGFELHDAIRKQHPDLAERLVFVSGDTLSPATHTRLAQSGIPFIAKPFAVGQLEQLIRSILARRPLPQTE